MNAVSGSRDHLSIHDWWRIEYLYHGTSRWSEASFEEGVAELIKSGVLSVENKRVFFSGDDFDAIYINYIARQKSANLNFYRFDIELTLVTGLIDILRYFDQIMPISAVVVFENLDVMEDTNRVFSKEAGGKKLPLFSEDLIYLLLRLNVGKKVAVHEMFMTSTLGSTHTWFIWKEPDQTQGIKKLRRLIAEITHRGEEVGIGVHHRSWVITVPGPTEIALLVRSNGDEHLCTRVGRVFLKMIPYFYLEQKAPEQALAIAEQRGVRTSGANPIHA